MAQIVKKLYEKNLITVALSEELTETAKKNAQTDMLAWPQAPASFSYTSTPSTIIAFPAPPSPLPYYSETNSSSSSSSASSSSPTTTPENTSG